MLSLLLKPNPQYWLQLSDKCNLLWKSNSFGNLSNSNHLISSEVQRFSTALLLNIKLLTDLSLYSSLTEELWSHTKPCAWGEYTGQLYTSVSSCQINAGTFNTIEKCMRVVHFPKASVPFFQGWKTFSLVFISTQAPMVNHDFTQWNMPWEISQRKKLPA